MAMMMIAGTPPVFDQQPDLRGQAGYLELPGYDLALCKRLALSPRTEAAIKRVAKLLLEMHRLGDGRVIARRTGVAVLALEVIRERYVHEGLQEVLRISLPGPLPSSAHKVELTHAERLFCENVVMSQEGSKGRHRRARALLMLGDGKCRPQVAQAARVCERTLERLVDRYQTHGAEGAVNDAERPGRPVRYPREEFVPLIQKVIRQENPAVLLRWTIKDLRRSLACHRQEAASMSLPTLRSLVQGAGIEVPSRGMLKRPA